MVLPIGVGVGDFIAVARLTGQVVSELKKVGLLHDPQILQIDGNIYLENDREPSH